MGFGNIFSSNNAITGSVASFGTPGANLGIKAISDSMSNDRTNENADKQRELEYQQQMAALGMDELKQYKDAKIDDATQSMIDKRIAAEEAQMKQNLSNAGITESTTALSGEAGVQTDKINMQELELDRIKQMHWDAAVKALGLSDQSSQVLAGMNEADRQQAMEIYNSTMSIMGQTAGKYSGSSNYQSVVSGYTNQQFSYDPRQDTSAVGGYDPRQPQ